MTTRAQESRARRASLGHRRDQCGVKMVRVVPVRERSPETLLAGLTSIAAHLGCDELMVLTLIADRLLLGRQQYGDLAVETDRRDFAQEALEEAADMAVYAAAGLLRTEPGVKAINTHKRRR